MKSVELHPLAEVEMREAAERYEAARPELGREFLAEFRKLLELAATFPEAAPRIEGDIRRSVLSRFPYSILYRSMAQGRLRVLAIAHHSRRPEYWVDRAADPR